MAEKPDKNSVLIEKEVKAQKETAAAQKEAVELQKKDLEARTQAHAREQASLQKSIDKQERRNTLLDINNELEAAKITADQLEAEGNKEQAEAIRAAIESFNGLRGEQLAQGNFNTKQAATFLKEAQKVSELAGEFDLDTDDEKENPAFEALKTSSLKTLNQLTESINQDKEFAENDAAMVEKQLDAMDRFYMGDKSNSDAIRKELVKAQELINSGDEEDRKIGLEMLKQAKSAGEDEEKRREAAEQAELQNMALTRIGDGITGLGEKLGDFGKSAVKTGGLLAGLAGLVLGVVDPEKLVEIITSLTEGFLEIIEGVVLFFEGDFEGAKAKIGENIELFGGLILGLALYFGGPLISAIGGLFGKLAKLVRMIKVFRVFMLSTFIPSMISTLGTMLTGLGAVLIPILPIVAIIAVIAAAFYALKSSLGEGATVMDTLKLGALYLIDGLSMLVNGITFLPRKIFEFLGGGRLARWLFGDEVGDMVDQFLGEGLDTNRAGKFKEETKARLAQEKRDKELQEQAEEEGVIIDGVDITDPTSADNLAAAQNENAQGNLDIATAGQDGITASVNNVQSTSSSTRNTVIQYSVPNSSASILGMLTR